MIPFCKRTQKNSEFRKYNNGQGHTNFGMADCVLRSCVLDITQSACLLVAHAECVACCFRAFLACVLACFACLVTPFPAQRPTTNHRREDGDYTINKSQKEKSILQLSANLNLTQKH